MSKNLTIISTADAIKRQQKSEALIASATLDDGRVKMLSRVGDGNYTVAVKARASASGATLIWSGPEADLAEAYYEAFDGVKRDWNAAYLPRGTNWPTEQKTMTVFAVGQTIEACIVAFCDSLASLMTGLETERVDDAGRDGGYKWGRDGGYQWSARFNANGTSMKAAGIFVPGGAVMTYWM